VLVVANKDPQRGHRLSTRLQRPGRRVRLVASALPRPALLDLLARSLVTVFAPNRTEGFYLPALEGMALGTVVVCPDCVGNRSFCVPGRNCFRPPASEDATVAAVEAALNLDVAGRQLMLQRAAAIAAEHDLGRERKSFLTILSGIRELWKE
jgi:glycosyltransferase involved in cell wall biosynthesis